MQVLKTTVKLRPQQHPAGPSTSWFSGWVHSRDSRIIKTSPSLKRFEGHQLSELIHWARCLGGEKAVKSEFVDASA